MKNVFVIIFKNYNLSRDFLSPQLIRAQKYLRDSLIFLQLAVEKNRFTFDRDLETQIRNMCLKKLASLLKK